MSNLIIIIVIILDRPLFVHKRELLGITIIITIIIHYNHVNVTVTVTSTRSPTLFPGNFFGYNAISVHDIEKRAMQSKVHAPPDPIAAMQKKVHALPDPISAMQS